MHNLNNSAALGFLQTIISFNNDDEPILVIRPVSLLSTADSLNEYIDLPTFCTE